MGCHDISKRELNNAKDAINRALKQACDCATNACECKDVAVQAQISAQSSAQSAYTSATQSSAIWNDFQSRYLGAFATNPTTSIVGALYFNTTTSEFYVWNGTIWQASIDGVNDLDKMFKSASDTYYHDIIYTVGGDVSAIEVFTDSTRAVPLYTRTITYDGLGNITQVVTVDEQIPSVSLTKTITYDGSGDISNLERIYNF